MPSFHFRRRHPHGLACRTWPPTPRALAAFGAVYSSERPHRPCARAHTCTHVRTKNGRTSWADRHVCITERARRRVQISPRPPPSPLSAYGSTAFLPMLLAASAERCLLVEGTLGGYPWQLSPGEVRGWRIRRCRRALGMSNVLSRPRWSPACHRSRSQMIRLAHHCTHRQPPTSADLASVAAVAALFVAASAGGQCHRGAGRQS